jgi:signal transduction histidine kinase
VPQASLLANLPPTPRQRSIAFAIVLIMLAAFVATAPFGSIQLPRSTAFIAAFQTILFINDLITATLLFAHFSILRWPALLALASGYLFTALIAVAYALTFPGLFSPTGLFGAGYQTAGWLYLVWHCGLPLAVIAYALAGREDHAPGDSLLGSPRAAILSCVAVVTAAAAGSMWVAVAADETLPKLFEDEVHISAFGRQISVGMALLSALALALVWSRRRSLLDLWLMVVLSAWLLEIAFFVVLTALRFSLAFYTSRIYAVVTASVVLLVLLSEMTALYVRLARSTVMQRREREGHVISMDAMSASIAHEMSQPIGAMMASADAALLWLEKTPPDFDNLRKSIERIAADGRRAGELIASVRTVFRKSGGKDEPVEVNALIREVLAIEQRELAHRRIQLKVELGRAVPKVSFDRVQLQQVVLNLITNAVEAMSAVTDRPHVLRVTSQGDGQGQVEIAVADTGTGIDRKITDQIFEPFVTTKPEGMGLGLWICRRIVENRNGRVTVDSEPGHGSVFRIILPDEHGARSAPRSDAG